jgi:ribonuclease-3
VTTVPRLLDRLSAGWAASRPKVVPAVKKATHRAAEWADTLDEPRAEPVARDEPTERRDAVAPRLTDRLGHRFADEGLFLEALTHRSWCAEHEGTPSNERLEFLGDAVLGLVVAEHLFRVDDVMPEGELAMARAAVVSTEALAQVAAGLDLGEYLRLGKGEDATGGRTKRSILADAMEAVFGAVFLDAGLDAARGVILPLLSDRLAGAVADPGDTDHKTRLQEASARRYGQVPRYDVSGTGPDHEREFTAIVRISGEERGRGTGRTKKEAEQAAAEEAYRSLRDNEAADA